MTVYSLVYKHFMYQEDIIEGNKDPQSIQSAYERWSSFCAVTAITTKYIKIDYINRHG